MTTSLKGFDAYGDGPSASAAASAGYVWRNCYASPDSSKNMSADAVASYGDAGIWLLTNYENAATDATGGYSSGQSHLLAAVAEYKPKGMPLGAAVFLSADQDISESEFPSVLPYFQGAHEAAAGNYLVGCYGEEALISYLFSNGVIDLGGWRSASTAFPGGTSLVRVAMYQGGEASIGGVTVDVDTAIVPFFGQWKPGQLAQTTNTNQQEIEMIIVKGSSDAQYTYNGSVLEQITDGTTLGVLITALGASHVVSDTQILAWQAANPPSASTIQASVTAGVLAGFAGATVNVAGGLTEAQTTAAVQAALSGVTLTVS